MSILKGFIKAKKYRKTIEGYKLESHWTSSETVEMNDGRTLQEFSQDKGQPNGIASLGEDGKVPTEQLPDNIGVDLSVVSDKFLKDKEYSTGEYCIYNDVLYKFTNAKKAGEWDNSVAEATTVGTELDSLNTNLNGKQDTITGGASTITASNLTANRALISNGSGKEAVSAVTSTQLGYLSGVTSAIQTQFNNIKTSLGGASFYYGGNLTNQDVTTWCMNNRRAGITIFQCGQGVIPTQLQYAMGLLISNGSNRLNIVVFGASYIYTRIINDDSLDNPWKRVAVSSF